MAYQYGKTLPRQTLEELHRTRQAVQQLQAAHDAMAAEKAALERQLAKAKAVRPAPVVRQRKQRPLRPTYGGEVGLLAATKESQDLDKRTMQQIKAGHDSEWIREFKRIRNMK